MKFDKLHNDAVTPKRHYVGDVGFDVTFISYSVEKDNVIMFHSGISVTPPPNFFTLLAARSSAYKFGITPVNGVGIIDPNYSGDISFPVYIFDESRFYKKINIKNVDEETERSYIEPVRLAQLIPLPSGVPVSANDWDKNKGVRGQNGFGSSGL